MKFLGVAIWFALLAVVLAAGCGQEGQGAGSTSTVPESRTETSQGAPAETTARSDEASGGEATEAPFTAAPEAGGGMEGAANSIQSVRFGEHEGYERAVISFDSEDASASRVPVWSLSSPTGEGYARITFPGADATSVTDGTFGGSILDNFYVVRAPSGGLFVDLFATGAFQYRVAELTDPGRLVVDYRPVSDTLSFPIPTRTTKTVLFEPRQGEAITSPLKVSGYSRNFEGSNSITLRDSSGNVLSRRTVLSNDWADTWGYFEGSLEFPAFAGQATLQVGSGSPRDGSFEGAEVPVTYDGG